MLAANALAPSHAGLSFTPILDSLHFGHLGFRAAKVPFDNASDPFDFSDEEFPSLDATHTPLTKIAESRCSRSARRESSSAHPATKTPATPQESSARSLLAEARIAARSSPLG